MVELIVTAVILIMIMLVFVFFLFKNILKRMNDNAKRYFVNKMQDFDYILDDKKKELENLKAEIEEIENHQNIIKKEDVIVSKVIREQKKEDEFIEVQYELKTPKFREEDFFKNYKELKKIFSINNDDIVKNFIKAHKNEKEEKEYKALKKLREKFDDDSIYQCLTLNKKDQQEVMDEVLTNTDKKLIKLDKLLEDNAEFGIEDLIKFFESRMDEINPTIYIYMNVLDDRYKSMDKNIIMKQYNNMSEGLIIKYRNKIYDYSI